MEGHKESFVKLKETDWDILKRLETKNEEKDRYSGK